MQQLLQLQLAQLDGNCAHMYNMCSTYYAYTKWVPPLPARLAGMRRACKLRRWGRWFKRSKISCNRFRTWRNDANDLHTLLIIACEFSMHSQSRCGDEEDPTAQFDVITMRMRWKIDDIVRRQWRMTSTAHDALLNLRHSLSHAHTQMAIIMIPYAVRITLACTLSYILHTKQGIVGFMCCSAKCQWFEWHNAWMRLLDVRRFAARSDRSFYSLTFHWNYTCSCARRNCHDDDDVDDDTESVQYLFVCDVVIMAAPNRI